MARRKRVQQLVRPRRHKVFFGKQLDGVSHQGVYDAKIKGKFSKHRGSIGTNPVLQNRAAFALYPQQQPAEIQHHQHHQQGQAKRDEKIYHTASDASAPGAEADSARFANASIRLSVLSGVCCS